MTFGGYQRPLLIGGQREGSDATAPVDLFTGTIDEVMLWNRALAAAEIRQYHGGAQPRAR